MPASIVSEEYKVITIFCNFFIDFDEHFRIDMFTIHNSCLHAIFLRNSGNHIPSLHHLLFRDSFNMLSIWWPFESLVGSIRKMNLVNEYNPLIHRFGLDNFSFCRLINIFLNFCDFSITFVNFFYYFNFYFLLFKMLSQMVEIKNKTRIFFFNSFNSIKQT